MTEPNTSSHQDEGCICFPEGEHRDLTAEEREAAEELQCPRHGRRIPFEIYRAKWLRKAQPSMPSDDHENRRISHSAQYRRALAATHAYMAGRQ